MPNYDIQYYNPDGSMDARVVAQCADDREAKILAHALKDKGWKRIKVLTTEDERRLIYQRPATWAIAR